MIEVFKVALVQRLLFLSMDMIYSTMEGIVPSRCRLTTRPLGATLVEVFMSIRQLQVPSCCKHDNAALGGYR